jgi:hypothetical protein
MTMLLKLRQFLLRKELPVSSGDVEHGQIKANGFA